MTQTLQAGAGVADISPVDSQFLYGYPHVERYSTGIHDPLLSSALHLCDGQTSILFVANDIIYVPKDLVARARARVEQATGVPAGNILISATHTHSGPVVLNSLIHADDSVIPAADPNYVRRLEDGIVAAAEAAVRSARPAEAGLACATAEGVGTNRRDPSGPADPQAPVLLVRDGNTHTPIAAMLVYSMHPTVLHEDSTLVSGDFPAMTRRYLQAGALPKDCPVLHHIGPAGNQSPRHCVRGQTFEEAQRLGGHLGRAVKVVLPDIEFHANLPLAASQDFVDLPVRTFPSVAQAEAKLQAVAEKLQRQRNDGTPRAQVRTTECDWFGAEETLTLAKAVRNGRLEQAHRSCLPAEIQILRVGHWRFVAWPGELFVEYALAVKAQSPDTFVLSCANGVLLGYIVTPEAAEEGGYEASNATFAPEAGDVLVRKTLKRLAT